MNISVLSKGLLTAGKEALRRSSNAVQRTVSGLGLKLPALARDCVTLSTSQNINNSANSKRLEVWANMAGKKFIKILTSLANGQISDKDYLKMVNFVGRTKERRTFFNKLANKYISAETIKGRPISSKFIERISLFFNDLSNLSEGLPIDSYNKRIEAFFKRS